MDAPQNLPWNPTHPNCRAISDDTISTGRKALEQCRKLVARAGKKRTPLANVRMADAHIDMAGGGSAVEYTAYLRQLASEQAA